MQVGMVQRGEDESAGDTATARFGLHHDIVNLPIDRRGDEEESIGMARVIPVDRDMTNAGPDREELAPCSELPGDQVPECLASWLIG
jgi:hypothetical protein